MSKPAIQIFGTFAVVFAIVIPFLAINGTGSNGASIKPIAASDQNAQHLFQTNCGTCHTLAAGGTDGVVGPNLDVLLAGGALASQTTVDGNCTRVLQAITYGKGGRMPRGILEGDEALEVASFVARNANYLGLAPPTSSTSGGSSGGSSGSATSSSSASAPITAASTKCSAASSGSTSSSTGSG
ncbi:MAG: cytochrome [Solirubrobacterales bacterium]|jgi:mono/diheme cytochrome c family protein|nr:cytochrome [Solirubrobacterales bacterium]